MMGRSPFGFRRNPPRTGPAISPSPQGNRQQRQTLATLNAGSGQGRVTLTINPNAPPGVHTIVLRGQAPYVLSKDRNRQRQNLVVDEPSNPITVRMGRS